MLTSRRESVMREEEKNLSTETELEGFDLLLLEVLSLKNQARAYSDTINNSDSN